MTLNYRYSQQHLQAAAEFFNQNGFVVIQQLASANKLQQLKRFAETQLAAPSPPWELEAELGYPGAPKSTLAKGGQTVRRLLDAVTRDYNVLNWATGEETKQLLTLLFSDSKLLLSRVHHNCLMTKAPEFSSDTNWHQDIRYWSFSSADLISAWTALDEENSTNGGLIVIPGSHQLNFTKHQFDEQKFFTEHSAENSALIETQIALELFAGDVLFFHCRLLHRATRNFSNKIKMSLVFTYHNSDIQPQPDSRSSSLPEIPF